MSWEIKTIGDVCTIEKGNIGITKAIAGDYPLVVLGEGRKTHNEYQFDDEAVIIPLVSSTGHGDKSMKRIHYQSGKFSVGNILCAVIPKNKSVLSAQYLYRYLDLNKESELVSRMKGMANVSLPMKSIAEVEIPIPPVEIQREIVARLSSLEESNNELFEEQSFQLDLLKKLRQQILQDAVQGKLIPHDPNDEPASVLLERIKAEKEKLVREKKIKKEKPLQPIKQEDLPFEIPENWVWCKLGELCFKITDGFHNTPPKISIGIPYISATHVKSDKIDWKNCDYVAENYHRELFVKAYPKKGELLVVNIGAGCGTPAIIDIDYEFSFKNTAILKSNQELINNDFLFYYFLLSKESIYNTLTQGGLQPFLSLKILYNIQIPLPPIKEQHRITIKIKELMTLCDELEHSIQHSQKYTEELLQVALKEALEPQEAE